MSCSKCFSRANSSDIRKILSPPVDIPLYVPEGSIIGVEEFVSYIEKNKQLPPYGEENNLITKKLLTDLENNKFHL